MSRTIGVFGHSDVSKITITNTLKNINMSNSKENLGTYNAAIQEEAQQFINMPLLPSMPYRRSKHWEARRLRALARIGKRKNRGYEKSRRRRR